MCKVIGLHRVLDGELLEKVLLHLKKTTTLVSIEELDQAYEEGRDLRNLCHISIDDGDISSYEVIYPLLKKHNVPATLFVSPGICLKKENYWFQEVADYNAERLHRVACESIDMDPHLLGSYPGMAILKTMKIDEIWEVVGEYRRQYNALPKEPQNIDGEQILEMDRQGLVTMGAHTMNHPILANEESEKSRWEITESVHSLGNLLGHEIRYFAYPNGLPGLDYGSREVEFVGKAGCRMAFSNHLDRFNLDDNPFRIPRYGLEVPYFRSSFGNQSIIKVKLLLGSRWDRIKSLYTRDEGKWRIDLRKRIQEIRS